MKNISKVKTKCILRNRPKFMTFKRTFYMIYAKYNVTSRRMREITCRKYPERNFFVVCVYLQIKMKREKQQKQFPAFQTNHTTYDNLKNKITHTEILANFSMKMHIFLMPYIYTYFSKKVEATKHVAVFTIIIYYYSSSCIF